MRFSADVIKKSELNKGTRIKTQSQLEGPAPWSLAPRDTFYEPSHPDRPQGLESSLLTHISIPFHISDQGRLGHDWRWRMIVWAVTYAWIYVSMTTWALSLTALGEVSLGLWLESSALWILTHRGISQAIPRLPNPRDPRAFGLYPQPSHTAIKNWSPPEFHQWLPGSHFQWHQEKEWSSKSHVPPVLIGEKDNS